VSCATVLVVEDNPVNMRLAHDILEALGYGVLQATDAEAGIALARDQRPDLILMDVSLPGMDGLAATSTLKQDPLTSAIPVVALTAHAMRGDAELASSAGADGYLTKPIDLRAFRETVARLIEKPE
jgi:two-component system cell cycle response regulator DivK